MVADGIGTGTPGATEQSSRATLPGMLQGVRVVEVADELGEYAGLLMAGMGADVVKVEPPEGAPTRRIGPFYEDIPGPDRSLHFWHYNRAKRSVALDLDTAAGRDSLLRLLEDADVLIDTSCGRVNAALGLDRAALLARFPRLVLARITPFGDIGPWKDFKGSDLIHLALGGVMSNCGYDPDPTGRYDVSPIAPQVWHAYHIAGEQLAIGVTAALLYRRESGQGQDVSVAVHEAVAKNTELDLMAWVMRRVPLWRLTCRHAAEVLGRVPAVGHTKDGRWFMTYLGGPKDELALHGFLGKYGMQADLEKPDEGANMNARAIPGSSTADERRAHIFEIMHRFIRSFRYEDMPWKEAQDAGLLWAPLRKPHENALDEHWLARGTFTDVEHPALGRSIRYVTSKWLSTATSWQVGRPAPAIGEHTAEVLATRRPAAPLPASARTEPPLLSPRGKPFPLQGVRIFDFSWFLASAGGTRILSAMGADVMKVEWKANPDTRLAAMAPVGGRAAREKATGPLPGVTDSDMGGQFNNKNAGKRGLSLNIRHPRGLQIAKDLIRISDVVAEGFSPGVLQRLGLGWDVLRSIRPDMIYIQQSGMGSIGKYGRMRTVGPVAASFAGTSDMSGLPEPAMPVGWGYSYLDWMGAYSFALAILGGLHHRARTGEGQWIDASQTETGILLAGTTILDWSANGRVWSRYGNRSPYKPAAPHGAYRCRGDDRWLAVACFDDPQWTALARVAGHPEWLDDPRFATLEARLAHQDALDALVTGWTTGEDDYDAMMRLQAAGVPAGASQAARDRIERDPQLAALGWLTEVTGTKIGRWPVGEVSMRLAATPPYAGGPIDRGAPCYGEDNERILGDYLGMSKADVARLAEEGII